MADVNQDVGTMGVQGTVNMSVSMMKEALDAIAVYKDAIETAFGNLNTQYANVTANFTGDAANGLQDFYEKKIEAMLKQETGSVYQLLNALKGFCEAARDQIPGDSGVDNELGKVNRQ